MPARSHGESPRGPGHPGTKEFYAWSDMLRRCRKPRAKEAAYWLDRGVKVCDEWKGRNGYLTFLAHIGRAPEGRYSIDRWPDRDGNYEPGNVRWATDTEQANNRRQKRSGWNRAYTPEKHPRDAKGHFIRKPT